MKISKKEFNDICAEVSAKNSMNTLETAKRLEDEKGGELAYTKMLMNVLFMKRIVRYLGFEDDNSVVEITKDTFEDAAQMVIATADKEMDSPEGKLIMLLEAMHFTALLKKRLFGEETEDEA